MTNIEEFARIISESDNIVFFGGAGVSTESNIKDFRSKDGLYNQKLLNGRSPEYMLSHECLMLEGELFYDYYRGNILAPWAKPNPAHTALSELEKRGKLKAVITQNIDGLHQIAGSKKVLELHGSTLRNYCETCGKNFELGYVEKSLGIPKCDSCKGRVRPDVVLYGEALDGDVMKEAVYFISKAEVLIIGGTSLVVYPAASLIQYFKGKKLVLINKERTPYDGHADLAINEPIGEVFSKTLELL